MPFYLRDRRVKLLDGVGTKIALMAGAGAALLLGTYLAPRFAGQLVTLPETAAPLIEEQVQFREPARLFQSFRPAARELLAATVRFQIPYDLPAPTDEVSDWALPAPGSAPRVVAGLIVAPDEILTTVAAVSGSSVVQLLLAEPEAVTGRVRVFDPEGRLVLVQIDSEHQGEPAGLAVIPPGASVFALAIGQSAQGDFMAPLTLEPRDDGFYRPMHAPPHLPAGTPLFDRNGQATAILVDDELAYPVTLALERTRRLLAAGHGIPSVAGVTMQTLSDDLKPFFGEAGVLLSDVASGSPADRAGLRPGDLLVQIGDVPVATVEDARRAIAAAAIGAPVELAFLRNQRPQTRAVTPDPQLDLEWGAAPPRAFTRTLPPDQAFDSRVLASSALPADAIVLQVNGRAPQRRMRARRPIVAYVDVAGRRYFTVVTEPARE